MGTTGWLLAADAVLVVHAAFVAFVVAGLAAIYLGGALGWSWVRGRGFRLAHLAAIAVVVVQSWFGVVCPLTTLEMALRARAGAATYAGAFVAHWVESALYWSAPDRVFTLVYTAFAAAVAASWFAVRPRSRRDAALPGSKRRTPAEASMEMPGISEGDDFVRVRDDDDRRRPPER